MFVKTYGNTVFGIDAETITTDKDVTRDLKFMLAGLADNAVKECQHGIDSASRVNAV